MAGCPLRNFEECPQHNKRGGCEWWMGYHSKSGVTDADMQGCAVVLQPLLQLEHANALGMLEGRMNQLSAEVSAGRVEHIREGDALRRQLLSLASGERTLVRPRHGEGLGLAKAPELEGGKGL